MRRLRRFIKAHGERGGPLSEPDSLLQRQKDAFFQSTRSLYFSSVPVEDCG